MGVNTYHLKWIVLLIQFFESGLDWLCWLTGKSETALTISLFSWTSFEVKIVETHTLHIFLVDSEAKGQLILKCLFGVFTFFQKTNKNKSTSKGRPR